MPKRPTILSLLLVVTTGGVGSATQPPTATDRVVIATLANDADPNSLDFQGAECQLADAGQSMECQFQQVFLTISPIDTQTCLITTNRYERRFEKSDANTWVSREPAQEPCGLVDVATLTDGGGGTRWTLEFRRTRTDRRRPECQGEDAPPERFSGTSARRALPCRQIQPGAIR